MDMASGTAAVEIDAREVAKGLGIDASLVHPLMRAGSITSRVERGEGQDAGRTRLTFFLENRRLQLVLEGDRVVGRYSVDFGDQPMPAALRR